MEHHKIYKMKKAFNPFSREFDAFFITIYLPEFFVGAIFDFTLIKYNDIAITNTKYNF